MLQSLTKNVYLLFSIVDNRLFEFYLFEMIFGTSCRASVGKMYGAYFSTRCYAL